MMIDPVKALARRCKQSSQHRVAREFGVSVQHINDILKGRRAPGPRVLLGLGIERRLVYRRMNGSAPQGQTA